MHRVELKVLGTKKTLGGGTMEFLVYRVELKGRCNERKVKPRN